MVSEASTAKCSKHCPCRSPLPKGCRPLLQTTVLHAGQQQAAANAQSEEWVNSCEYICGGRAEDDLAVRLWRRACIQ